MPLGGHFYTAANKAYESLLGCDILQLMHLILQPELQIRFTKIGNTLIRLQML